MRIESLWCLLFVTNLVFVFSSTSFTYVDNATPKALFHYTNPSLYNSNSSFGPSPFKGPATCIDTDGRYIYVSTPNMLYQFDAVTFLQTTTTPYSNSLLQYLVYQAPTATYQVTLTNRSTQASLSVRTIIGYTSSVVSFTLGTSNVSIAIDRVGYNILFYYPTQGTLYKLPFNSLNSNSYLKIASNVSGIILPSTSFPLMYDEVTNMVLWGGNTDSGYIVYGMQVTNNNTIQVVYSVNTTDGLMMSAGGGNLYGLQLNDSSSDGWFWQCNILTCVPQYMSSVPVPALVPFKYDNLNSNALFYSTSDRSATVRLFNNQLQNIISPRQIASFVYSASMYYYLTDTGLLESYYSGQMRSYAYIPIANQNVYYDQDTSNYSLAYDQSNNVFYAMTQGIIYRVYIPYSSTVPVVVTRMNSNVQNLHTLYMAYAGYLLSCDASNNTISYVMPPSLYGKNTSVIPSLNYLNFSVIATFDTLPEQIVYIAGIWNIFAVNANGVYSNRNNLSVMAYEQQIPGSYIPYAIAAVNSLYSYFLAVDMNCPSCLSIQSAYCGPSAPCLVSKIIDIPAPYNTVPAADAALIIVHDDVFTTSLILKINSQTPILKITGVTQSYPVVSVLCSTYGLGSIAATNHSVLIPATGNSTGNIMELDFAGEIVNEYPFPVPVSASWIFTVDAITQRFIYFSPTTQTLYLCSNVTLTNCTNYYGFSPSTAPLSLVASSGFIYYAIASGGARAMLWSSSGYYYSAILETPGNAKYFLSAYANYVFVSNSTYPSVSYFDATRYSASGNPIYVASSKATGIAYDNNNIYWMSSGTSSILSWSYVKNYNVYYTPIIVPVVTIDRTTASEMVGLYVSQSNNYITSTTGYSSYSSYSSSYSSGNGNSGNSSGGGNGGNGGLIVLTIVVPALVIIIIVVSIACHRAQRMRRNAQYLSLGDNTRISRTTQIVPTVVATYPPTVPFPAHSSPTYGTSTRSTVPPAMAVDNNEGTLTSEEALLCPICLQYKKDTALGCGHVMCKPCVASLTVCPFCKAPITARTKIYL